MNARDIMTTHVVSVRSDATVDQAVEIMLNRHFSGLPVVDDKGRLVGIVTEGDLLRRQELGTQQPFEVISGYRSPATNDTLRSTRGGGVAKHSLHMVGKAIDVRLPGVPLTELRDAALSLRQGGVGFYPSEQFVHLDTGPVRRW